VPRKLGDLQQSATPEGLKLVALNEEEPPLVLPSPPAAELLALPEVREATEKPAESTAASDKKAEGDKKEETKKEETPHCPEPELPLPLPNLPPGVGMGGFPARPDHIADPSKLEKVVRENLTVRLRGSGILRPYGFLRGDLDFATSRFNDLQNPFFVLPDDPNFRLGPLLVPIKPDDFNYSLYPRLTRAGVEYFGPAIDLPCCCCTQILPSGRLEIDFLTINPGGPESRELLRLRLAYAQLQLGDWTLVVGQDWDIVAPLIPTINDNTLQWYNGNLGDRRPQMKLLYDHDFGYGYRLQIQNGIALADAINSADIDADLERDNEATGIPGYQGRIGVVLPTVYCNQVVMAGVWGIWAREETAVPVAGKSQFTTLGFGADLRFPINDYLAVQSEIWWGSNIDDYRGGIAQGINRLTGQEIESRGGWAELVFRPVPWYQGSVGFSIDDPLDSDIPVGGRTRNYAWYIGTRFPLRGGLTFGMDYQNWTTTYNGFHAGHASLFKFFAQLNY
jgi:hypothetical protein